jgi:hypothetical protein
MAQTFPGSRETWGMHVLVVKSEGGTRHAPSEWTSPKTIFLLKKNVCLFSRYSMIRINV